MRHVVTAWTTYLAAAATITYFAVLLPLRDTPLREITWRALAHRWESWDSSLFYLPIASHGYTKPVEANFFPGYPLLVRGLWLLCGKQHLLGCALTISIAAFLAALFGVAALAQQMRIPTGWALLVLLTASPVAWFLVAPYPTSLLLAFVVWVLYFAGKTDWPYHWQAATALAFFAPLVHPTAIVLWPTLIVEFIWQHRRSWRNWYTLLQGSSALLCVPAGLGLWCAYCAQRFHDPLAWLHSQRHYFGHVFMWPWQAIGLLWRDWQRIPTPSYTQARLLVDLLPIIFSLVVFAWALRSRSLPISWYVLWGLLIYLTIASPTSGAGIQVIDPIVSAGRYLLPAVPSTLFLARAAKEPRIQTWLSFLLTIGVVLQVVTLSFYLTGGWIV